jgi:hypothetical protein
MFRILDNKIHVYGKWVPMLPGAHKITSDPETGAIVTDGTGTELCSYTLGDDGKASITSSLPAGVDGRRAIRGLSAIFQRKVHAGPLYGGTYGGGPVLQGVMEGFLFTFNYYATAYISSAMRPYLWTGGRVCFKSFFTPDGAAPTSDGSNLYTALPSAMSCGNAGVDTMLTEGAVMPPSMANYGFMGAMQNDSLQWLYNSTSIVFSYRTHRKYMFFASNIYGLFETSFGPIAGGDGGFPSGGSIPDPSSTSFRFSSFSLRQ